MLNVLDEFSHECLAIRVARKLKAIDVIDILSDLFIQHGIPTHIRSDNGTEFVAKTVQQWIGSVTSSAALQLLRVSGKRVALQTIAASIVVGVARSLRSGLGPDQSPALGDRSRALSRTCRLTWLLP
jgi:transposase InsO family protein